MSDVHVASPIYRTPPKDYILVLSSGIKEVSITREHFYFQVVWHKASAVSINSKPQVVQGVRLQRIREQLFEDTQ